jgi:two-component system sensor histidine kinase KdpD
MRSDEDLDKTPWTDNGFVAYTAAILGILAPTLLLIPVRDQINTTTIALAFLLIVLLVASLFGSRPALLASVMVRSRSISVPAAVLHINDRRAAELDRTCRFPDRGRHCRPTLANAKSRAEVAEDLYEKLQAAFEQASEAEALKKSEKLKSSLLDAVTHDLRTPLTSIKASVTTLLDSEGGHRTIELDAEGRREFLDIINEETDRLNKFIESMVELARIESGSAPAKRKLSNVEEIISIALTRAEQIPGGHRVVLKIEKDLPLINVDARAIAEALYNLIENAAKYSADRSIIEIKARAQGEGVRVSITDEGRGIPTDMRDRVFEKFVRLDADQSSGMGLGLPIARGIVESQGGTIEIQNGLGGKGTTFVIDLPIGEE